MKRCVCVRECQICQQSSLLNLKHTHTCARYSSGRTQTRPLYYEGFIFSLLLWQFPSFPTASLSSILLLPRHPPCLLLAPFLLVTSSQPHPLSFSLVIPPHPPCSPPSLTPQLESTMKWQWQGCGMCVRALVFVCVMSHHSSSIVALSFFNPRAHRPHCYFKIL